MKIYERVIGGKCEKQGQFLNALEDLGSSRDPEETRVCVAVGG